ncbi:related to mating protein SSF1 [Ramularia collo-cygni]|uniref:Related to mating protein SSF1 n=1 Tax=Ramularia collo-cygni TaxID=112498 RepID=A0A2D3UQW3_9PEZI|nr:related to mating protein SSF1 [Ramularia collo-cygni]CZT15765.1 related to mating protein SSF1 [Ramularia collo-cygni]
MAKRRVKKRTHVGASIAPGVKSNHAATSKAGTRPPKSMVIRVGASDVGPSVSQLVKDVRTMMEPDTASRLKERRSNKLRDYTAMAGPLGVTHLMLFSRSSTGNTNLRLALTPRGPTLHFRVEKYSLCKDVFHSMKRPKTSGTENLSPPLLVMNNFTTKDMEGEEKDKKKIPKHLESLTTSIFQSLFPPINPATMPLKGIKRVMLLDREPQDPKDDAATYVLNLRHYAIETRTAKSVPKPLRKLDAAEKAPLHAGQKRKRGNLPNLGKLNDVADYLLDPHAADGFTSGSDSEPDTDAEVEIDMPHARKVRRTKASGGEKKDGVLRKAVKMHELGPRLRLRLTKVEEGVCNGKVMWHEYIHKTKEEMKEMEKAHEKKRLERDRRRAEQKANVERKKKEKKPAAKEGEEEEDEDEVIPADSDDEWDDEEGLYNDDEEDAAGQGAEEDSDEEMEDGSEVG